MTGNREYESASGSAALYSIKYTKKDRAGRREKVG